MNNLSIFICVVFCMISHVYGDIRIANELKFNKNLWISCFSGDDRMEPVVKKPGEQYRISFSTNYWGTTQFMCTLRQGPNYRHSQSFTAFKQVSPSDWGALWDWRAREDGIYLEVWEDHNSQGGTNMHKAFDWIN
ncbi:Plant self-incompatibility protein S1 family [Raphanus sativus]|nr:Plant self-incompatibility protein S1 family [Raphanus sativus]